MRSNFITLGIALVCLCCSLEAKTVFRRADKISDNFKKLNLPAEEIDPNVAPPPQKVQVFSTPDVSSVSATGSDSGTLLAEDAIEQLEEDAAAVDNEIIDEAVNEVEVADTGVPAEEVVAAVAAASPASSASATSAAAAAAVTPVEASTVENHDDPSAISRYCKCSDSHCDCCRQFNLPLIPVRGPGCAKITYLGNEKMSVSIKYGDITLATRTISGKRAKPICVGLPGGYSKFCGRVYGLSKGKEDFKACLGFELRAEDEVEAALRVSCFKFGPEGLRVADAEPLPTEVNKDEDEEDDIFGFGAGGDDDEEDDYDDEEEDDEPEEADEEADEPEENDDDEPEAPADADYGGFSLAGLLEELADEDEETKPVVTPAAAVAAAAAPSTRNVERKDAAQGKDDKGTEVTTSDVAPETEAATVLEEGAVATPAPAVAESGTTVKSKRSKKAKKNKKKKAAATSESDFAYEILNGILDFFN